jgi:hypothetical protein
MDLVASNCSVFDSMVRTFVPESAGRQAKKAILNRVWGRTRINLGI